MVGEKKAPAGRPFALTPNSSASASNLFIRSTKGPRSRVHLPSSVNVASPRECLLTTTDALRRRKTEGAFLVDRSRLRPLEERRAALSRLVAGLEHTARSATILVRGL